MDSKYIEKTTSFVAAKNFFYFGAFNSDGKLVAYCDVGIYGDFASFTQLMSYKNNDGAMHLLIVEITCQLIEKKMLNFLMYDTYFGALPGMKAFKENLGFKPYRVKYSIH